MARSAAPELRENAELQNEAFSVFRGEDRRQRKADVLPVPMKEQVIAPILRPVVHALDLCAVFGIVRKMFESFVFRVRKNVPLVIGVKLLPKDCDIGPGDRFTDGDLVFHVVSSKI